jgi:uncharacterized protein
VGHLPQPFASVNVLGRVAPYLRPSGTFVLANSLAGLAGNFVSVKNSPDAIPYWIAAAIGAFVGKQSGTRRLANKDIQRALTAILVIEGLKLLLT